MVGISNVNITISGISYETEIQLLGRSLSADQGYVGGASLVVSISNVSSDSHYYIWQKAEGYTFVPAVQI